MGPVKMHAELARSLHGRQFPLRLVSLATCPAPRGRSHVPPTRMAILCKAPGGEEGVLGRRNQATEALNTRRHAMTSGFARASAQQI